MTNLNKAQDFFNEYRLMYRPFINLINVQLEQYGLYSSQWGLLRLLEEKGPLTFGDIAIAMYIEKPSVTKLVQKLVELQFVEIKPGKDKREKVVHLTTDGLDKIKEIHSALKPMLQKALNGVTNEELSIAESVLTQICNNITNG